MSKSTGLVVAILAALGCGGPAASVTPDPRGMGGMGLGGGGTGGTTMLPAEPDPTRLFPATAPWYQDVTTAALDAESADVITGLDRAGGWGTGALRIDFSLEVLRADAGVAARPFTKTQDFYEPDCDFVPVPVPAGGRLEGETGYSCTSGGDCHLIVVQGTKLFEMWKANINGATFQGGCLAVWDLTRDHWNGQAAGGYARGDQCSSADAAGYPIAALLFSADEVSGGAINHAIRFILPNARIRKGEYVHPATHSGAGKGTPTPNLVPYGARFRLKGSFDVNVLPAGARVVARAMQRYGMFLADGGNIALTARADTDSATKWNGLLAARDLAMLKVTDFEMIEAGPRIPLTFNCQR